MKPYYEFKDRVRLYCGDCIEITKNLIGADAVICDPPYGLTANKKGGSGVKSINLDSPYGRSRVTTGNGQGGFMGQKWDACVPGHEFWSVIMLACKPGAHLLAFGGTRTFHRLACAIEDAGWELRDTLMWVYGSGFPKSHNLKGEHNGLGTALKPAWEPIILARKPLDGTVAQNVQQHGCGALNIDGCRIPVNPNVDDPRLGGTGDWDTQKSAKNVYQGGYAGERIGSSKLGRWPANLIHDGSNDVLQCFPNSAGQHGDVRGTEPSHTGDENTNCYGEYARVPAIARLDSGSAARFFYCAKASKLDRDEGLESGNYHPTVKPTTLMRYLCKLITPSDGLILDPFMGSGSTGKAAIMEGFRFIGVEKEDDYCRIAQLRIASVQNQPAQEVLPI